MKYASSHGAGISRGKHLALRVLGVGPGDEVIGSRDLKSCHAGEKHKSCARLYLRFQTKKVPKCVCENKMNGLIYILLDNVT